MTKIGVLALQGAFREHVQMLRSLGAETREVRLAGELDGLDGLILPGGESTTMCRLMTDFDLWEPVRAFHTSGGALWGTCAGAILLANTVEGVSPHLGAQPSLAVLDVTIQRNAFGRQVDSFVADISVKGLEGCFPAVFIRAPVFTRVGPDVEVLADWEGQTVLVRQGRVLASSFHPELSEDARLHAVFFELCSKKQKTHMPV
ncbi:pyridoxal 5'-phosphate synthase glutaminase subunit PdxT [Deinococcus fonticola]|uniref:pyridoxal 5'-phosphate synthase glutaminase subunit PdxT n=1 Tax=Deinococcus fonticola TaxID=2528713 RepID=UPI0010753ECD|nr:pyridoxal 5'-phosphate synthase glutaminase subunit PdxT [Deinococcus fonticola]